MKFNLEKTAIWGLIAICLLTISAVQIQAQRSTRVLVCNERDSVSDVMRYPSQARVVKTRSGTSSFLEYKGFIGNDKGNYDLTITSDSDFDYQIFTKSRTRNSKWQNKGKGVPKLSRTGDYFIHQQYFTSDGFYSNGYDIAIGIFPFERQANVKFLWYTTNCKKSPPPPRTPTGCAVRSMGGGLYGLSSKCVCNGAEVAMSRCSEKPKKFTSLNYMKLVKGDYSYIGQTEQTKLLKIINFL